MCVKNVRWHRVRSRERGFLSRPSVGECRLEGWEEVVTNWCWCYSTSPDDGGKPSNTGAKGGQYLGLDKLLNSFLKWVGMLSIHSVRLHSPHLLITPGNLYCCHSNNLISMQVKSKLKTGRNLTSPVRLKIKRKTTSGTCFPMMSPDSHTA